MTSFVFAEDDEGDNYRRVNITAPVVTPTPVPVTSPSPTPVSIILANTGGNSVLANPDNLVDSDSDGIIDILDIHPGEDDFAYAVKDVNGNGIADDLKYLQVK